MWLTNAIGYTAVGMTIGSFHPKFIIVSDLNIGFNVIIETSYNIQYGIAGSVVGTLVDIFTPQYSFSFTSNESIVTFFTALGSGIGTMNVSFQRSLTDHHTLIDEEIDDAKFLGATIGIGVGFAVAILKHLVTDSYYYLMGNNNDEPYYE